MSYLLWQLLRDAYSDPAQAAADCLDAADDPAGEAAAPAAESELTAGMNQGERRV